MFGFVLALSCPVLPGVSDHRGNVILHCCMDLPAIQLHSQHIPRSAQHIQAPRMMI